MALRALCVTIHDVAPATWPECRRLLQAIDAVAPIPLTLLVVPDYHHLPQVAPADYEQSLTRRLARGDELALHGWCHLDEGPAPLNLRQRWLRQVYTTGEGEFAALSEAQAECRLQLGLDWFAAREWPLHGFVAPAWLLSSGSWQALRRFPFAYTTTIRCFHLLPARRQLVAPSLTYCARNAAGRWLSRHGNLALAHSLAAQPLVRLGLHPNDARFAPLVRHFQGLLEQLLEHRQPMTKAGFARSGLI